MRKAIKVLRKCQITGKYKGYSYLLKAVNIFEKHYEEQICITKDIYPVIARECNTTAICVEHDIRTVIERCWRNNPSYVENIIGYRSCKCSSNMDFIDSLVYYTSTGEE